MLINHIWASIIEIWFQKWHTQSLKKIEIQMSRHEKRYRSEEMAPSAASGLFIALVIQIPAVNALSQPAFWSPAHVRRVRRF